jgi:hypothetical protein
LLKLCSPVLGAAIQLFERFSVRCSGFVGKGLPTYESMSPRSFFIGDSGVDRETAPDTGNKPQVGNPLPT